MRPRPCCPPRGRVRRRLGAQILLVPAGTTSATDGLDLSLAAIVDEAVAHTVAVGFSACEASLSEARQAFYAAVYRQAAAEGIAIVAAAGDNGASACQATGAGAVNTGYGVNALASTPWNTSVGVAALAEGGTTADGHSLAGWSPVSAADPANAGGGGKSLLYSAPAWQPLPAQDSTSAGGYARLMPDVALPTAVDSGVNRGLAYCLSGSATGSASSAGCVAVRSGGSAAAAAMFAGIASLLAAKNGPQGNLAPELYELSRRSGIFNDVQQGGDRLFCAAGSTGCDANGQIGFSAVAGYDMATGLGSVDAQKLVSAWATPEATGTGAASVNLSVTPTVPNTTYNPTAQITLTANVISLTGGATPTGTVLFADAETGGNLNPSGSTLDANGVANYTFTSGLKIGGNNITAIYSGDATYASVTSQPLVVTAEPSTTSLTVVPSTTKPTAGTSLYRDCEHRGRDAAGRNRGADRQSHAECGRSADRHGFACHHGRRHHRDVSLGDHQCGGRPSAAGRVCRRCELRRVHCSAGHGDHRQRRDRHGAGRGSPGS